ncbi:MAG: dTDP-4-dehydrorhamnose reductase [Paracoccaceae bacterium]
MGARILVVGRTGQVAQALAQADGTLVCLDRTVLDLTRPETIAPALAAARPDVVVNAAAYTAVDRAEEERDIAFAVNATGVGHLAAATAEAGAALLHLSTDYVYPGTRTGPHTEDDPTDPVNAYGASKLAGERAATAANPRTTILRTAWVYAPWGKNFALTMLRLADRERLRIVADQHGQPTSALDIAAACLTAAPRLAAAPAGADVFGVFHYAGRGATTWADFAAEIFAQAEAAGRIGGAPEIERIPTAAYPTPARRPANSTLDCSRFERVFGQPTRAWPEALSTVIAKLPAA